MSAGARRRRSGQALIEAAITIPIMIGLFLGFLAIGLVTQAVVDLNTAVYLSAVSAVTAPANNAALGNQYASETFNGSIRHVPELTSDGISCTGSWAPPAAVTCSAGARLMLRHTLLGIVVPFDPVLSASATAHGSPYRST